MNIEELREYCLCKKGVTEEMPFGPGTLVFKLMSKIFLLVGLDQIDTLSFNVKCDPVKASQLREDYPQTVFSGYHMNKRHWNTVYANRELSDAALQDLIEHSYGLVKAGLTKADQAKLKF